MKAIFILCLVFVASVIDTSVFSTRIYVGKW